MAAPAADWVAAVARALHLSYVECSWSCALAVLVAAVATLPLFWVCSQAPADSDIYVGAEPAVAAAAAPAPAPSNQQVAARSTSRAGQKPTDLGLVVAQKRLAFAGVCAAGTATGRPLIVTDVAEQMASHVEEAEKVQRYGAAAAAARAQVHGVAGLALSGHPWTCVNRVFWVDSECEGWPVLATRREEGDAAAAALVAAGHCAGQSIRTHVLVRCVNETEDISEWRIGPADNEFRSDQPLSESEEFHANSVAPRTTQQVDGHLPIGSHSWAVVMTPGSTEFCPIKASIVATTGEAVAVDREATAAHLMDHSHNPHHYNRIECSLLNQTHWDSFGALDGKFPLPWRTREMSDVLRAEIEAEDMQWQQQLEERQQRLQQREGQQRRRQRRREQLQQQQQ